MEHADEAKVGLFGKGFCFCEAMVRAAHQDDGGLDLIFDHDFQNLNAVHVGHHHVDEHDIRRLIPRNCLRHHKH